MTRIKVLCLFLALTGCTAATPGPTQSGSHPTMTVEVYITGLEEHITDASGKQTTKPHDPKIPLFIGLTNPPPKIAEAIQTCAKKTSAKHPMPQAAFQKCVTGALATSSAVPTR